MSTIIHKIVVNNHTRYELQTKVDTINLKD